MSILLTKVFMGGKKPIIRKSDQETCPKDEHSQADELLVRCRRKK